jgi:antitoxin component of MazEF toxin-antitoxin module
MAVIKRQADERGRVTLGGDFANQMVLVEQVGEGELRIRKVKRGVRRFTLDQLLANVTPDKLHPETEMSPAVGKEVI